MKRPFDRNKMKIKIYFWIAFGTISCLCFMLSGCAQNKEILTKQAEATRNLGEAYMKQGNYSLALRELLKAQKMDPGDPMVYNDLGLVYMAKERYDMAIENFKKALEINSGLAPAVNNLGNAYLRTEQWNLAIAQFEKLIDNLLYATPHYPLYGLGIAYYHKKDYQKAEQYLKETLKLEPEYFPALWWLGKTYLESGRGPEAREALKEAIEISPDFTPAYMVLAQSYLMTGDILQARRAYEKVISVDPGSPLAKQAKKELEQLNP
jgi:Tfp pilus assembly protein PilF